MSNVPFDIRQLSTANRTRQNVAILNFRLVVSRGVVHVLDVSAEADGMEVVEARGLDEVVVANNVTQTDGARARRNVPFGEELLKKREETSFQTDIRRIFYLL